MQAGKLRHVVYIEQPIVTEAEDGGQVVTYVPVSPRPVWARIEPVRMTETLLAAQVQPRETHRITLRYTTPFPPTYRLREKGTGRVFEPTSLKNRDERNREWEVLAIEQAVG